ncbi:MAG: hypothetical protein M0D57_15530 [Sphingobacteriales bacterium JAD_PAG50586_3]|nr:MAG: hypothetical protein M0D57_15530 [Sphingobacteriales bacterium JAD_PAG50586_3]
MKKWMVLFILFISLASIAQVLSSKELIDLNKLNDKKLKKHLVSRGYAIDPLSDTKGKHYTAMLGPAYKIYQANSLLGTSY